MGIGILTGTALRFTVPLGDGWAVARLRRRA
jgi:hypothetical protein